MDKVNNASEVKLPIKTAVDEFPVQLQDSAAVESEMLFIDEAEEYTPTTVEKPAPPKPAVKPKKSVVTQKNTDPSKVEIQENNQVVKEKPKKLQLVTGLKDSEFIEGEPCVLTVEANTKELLHAKWYIDENEIVEESDLLIFSEPPFYKLKIGSLLQDDAGEYMCVLSNKRNESVMSTCLLEVLDCDIKPKFLTILSDIEIESGEPVRFHVVVKGSSPLIVEWYYNGRLIEANEKYCIDNDNNSYFLTVNNATIYDAGEYEIYVENSAGSCSSIAELCVANACPILKKLHSEEMVFKNEGDLMEFNVSIENKVDAIITWYKDGVEMHESNRIEMLQDTAGCTLILENLLTKDSGIYTCQARNASGQTEVCFEFTVKGKNLH